MTTGWCTNCHTTGDVARYRLVEVGLRWLHTECAGRLSALGMDIRPVTDADPRTTNIGAVARRVHVEAEAPERHSDRRFALRLGWAR